MLEREENHLSETDLMFLNIHDPIKGWVYFNESLIESVTSNHPNLSLHLTPSDPKPVLSPVSPPDCLRFNKVLQYGVKDYIWKHIQWLLTYCSCGSLVSISYGLDVASLWVEYTEPIVVGVRRALEKKTDLCSSQHSPCHQWSAK